MKICILAANNGTRAGTFSTKGHNALLPFGNKAVISTIVEQFSKDDEFEIAVGYNSQLIKNYISIMHPNLKVKFTYVKNYDGSGLALSLYYCKESLQEPFIFIACDTLLTKPIPKLNTNWMGVHKVENIEKWCSVIIDENRFVKDIIYRKPADTNLAFIGVVYVHDYELFWNGLEKDKRLIRGKPHVYNGLRALITKGMKAIELGWEDTGNVENYRKALRHFENNLSFFGKTTDITYKSKNKIIKYFDDAQKTKERYKRALDYRDIFTDVIELKDNFYSYKFENGETLSKNLNYFECRKVLEWAEDHLWKEKKIEKEEFYCVLKNFYFDKSLNRLKKFIKEYLGKEIKIKINGLECETTEDLLKNIPDAFYKEGIASTYHGDFHSDNILITNKGFRLIDWRENFGRSFKIGDRYYDLAKFLHTLELSVETMGKGNFSIKKNNDVKINHQCEYAEMESLEAFWYFVKEKGYDEKKIKIINALIYINMAPLYKENMAKYLYYLGRYSLQKAVM